MSHGGVRSDRPANLLVIDDEEALCCLLHEILSERGYHTEIAMTGEDALEKVRRIPFDVILTDVCLPGLSGMEVLRTVRRLGLPSQVILVTAVATLELALEALREGAVDLIPKPIPDLQVVARAVERALERRLSAGQREAARQGARPPRRHSEEMLQALASLASQAAVSPTAFFLAQCASTVGLALGARRVEIELSLASEELPASVVWPEGSPGGGPSGPAEDRRAVLTHPLALGERTLGALRVTGPAESISKPQLDLLNSAAALASMALERAEVREEREASFVRFLEYLVHMRETTAGFEEGHSRRVADLAARLGRALGFSERGLALLRRAAAFHDLGKLGVDPELLSRPGPLSQSELASVRRHTEVAERLLGATACLEDVRHILRYLTGAPADPTEEERGPGGIPLESRILAAAEAFVAMTSPRPHRPALDRRQALEEMRREAGSRFDPEIVHALEALLESEAEEGPARTPAGAHGGRLPVRSG